MNRGKKLEEVFTVEGLFDRGSVDDHRTMIGYGSMDEAIKAAKGLEKDYRGKRYYKNFVALVCFNEWKYESGDIYGNRTCLSLNDLGLNKKKRK